MNFAKSYKYHLGVLAVLANPLDALVYRVVCVLSLSFVVWGLFIDAGNVVLWLLFLVVIAVTWRVFAYVQLPIKFGGIDAELCVTDQIIGMEVGKSYFYIPRRGALVKKGLFSTNIIKGSAGELLLINSSAFPIEVIKAVIQIEDVCSQGPQ